MKSQTSKVFGIFLCNIFKKSRIRRKNTTMKKFEVHTIVEKAGFSSMKEKLNEKVEHFLNEKANAGYEIVTVSFTYYEGAELIAFITICR